MNFSIDKKQAEKVNTFNGRIKLAMQVRQIYPQTPAELQRRWVAHYGTKNPISRQTFYDWFKSEKPKIAIMSLYALADLLDVNARWLSLFPGTDLGQMSKPIFMSPDRKALMDAFLALGPTGQDELITKANRLLAIQNESSQARPAKIKA
jgi:hypothetical protein